MMKSKSIWLKSISICQWREVKLFVIYVVDEEGNKIKKELPIIDGIIGSPQRVFNLLKNYLAGLDLNTVNNLVFFAYNHLYSL